MKKLRVLVVDDSAIFRGAARTFLATVAETECIGVAESAEMALQKIPVLAPDLVLMDYAMPGMHGIEATRRIRALPDAPQVVLVTMNDSADIFNAALACGAYGAIYKGEFAAKIPALILRLACGYAASSHPVNEAENETCNIES